MTYTVERPRRISKRVKQIQSEENDMFWKKTWPELKANGWSHDSKYGGFFPPEAQKQHAANRRRLGSDHKNFFKNIHELTQYLSQNPFLYVANNNEKNLVVNRDGDLVMECNKKRTEETTTTTTTTTSGSSSTVNAKSSSFNSPELSSKQNDTFSRSPSSIAAPTTMESTMAFLNQQKGSSVDQTDLLLSNMVGPSVLNLPPNALKLDVNSDNYNNFNNFDLGNEDVLTKGIGTNNKKKVKRKSLKVRGPGRPKGSKNIVKKEHTKVKVKKVKKKTTSSKHMYDSRGERIYICNRCGRDDFTNGHALGGHKKYCQKPEYDLARGKSAKTRKRSRSDTTNKKSMSNKRKPLFNLNGITNTIRKFADNFDHTPFENPFVDDNAMHVVSSEKFPLEEDLNILNQVIDTKDLFELEVIQHVLREEKARLAGRIAGLNTEEPNTIHFVGEENSNGGYDLNNNIDNDIVEHQQQQEIVQQIDSNIRPENCDDNNNSSHGTDSVWQSAEPSNAVRRVKSFEFAGIEVPGEGNSGGSEMYANDSGYDDGITNINPISFEESFFSSSSCDDVLEKNKINMDPTRAPSFPIDDVSDATKLEFLGGSAGDLAMQLGF